MMDKRRILIGTLMLAGGAALMFIGCVLVNVAWLLQ